MSEPPSPAQRPMHCRAGDPEQEPASPARDADHEQPGTTNAPAGDMYCKGCGYDLSATHDLVLCPECGRAFDPRVPRSFDRVARRELRRQSLRRTLLALLLVCLIGSGLYWSVIPRPISAAHPSLWLWLNQPTGVQHWPAHGTPRYRIVWRFGKARSVMIFERSAPTDRQILLATLHRARMDRDDFTLEVHRAGLSLAHLIQGFNILRTDEEVFGIQWRQHQPRPDSIGSFRAAGDMAEIMSAIIRHYGIAIQPLLLNPTDTMVWMFLPDGVELPEVAGALPANQRAPAADQPDPALALHGPAPPDGNGSVMGRANPDLWLNTHGWLGPVPGVPEPLRGRLVRATAEQAEAIGYSVGKPDMPIVLNRIDWRAARSGWY